MTGGLRILLRTDDPVRRQGLETMLQAAGHTLVENTPDVVLCDIAHDAATPPEAEAPVVALTGQPQPDELCAGILPRTVSAGQLDAALRAVAAGLLVRWPGAPSAE